MKQTQNFAGTSDVPFDLVDALQTSIATGIHPMQKTCPFQQLIILLDQIGLNEGDISPFEKGKNRVEIKSRMILQILLNAEDGLQCLGLRFQVTEKLDVA